MDKSIMDHDAIRQSLEKLRAHRVNLKALKTAPKKTKRGAGPLPEPDISSMLSNVMARKTGESK